MLQKTNEEEFDEEQEYLLLHHTCKGLATGRTDIDDEDEYIFDEADARDDDADDVHLFEE